MPTTANTRRKKRNEPRTETRRCAIYLRVSTEQQVDRQSLNTQESQLRGYADLHEWEVAGVFTDAGLSAKDTKRPGFQKMLRAVRKGRIDVILVAKLDRISRNLIDLLKLIDDLRDWGVDFVSASQSFDTATPMGMLVLNILGSFAQFEREMIAERVRENMHQRARSGLWSGGKPPFGYAINEETKRLEAVAGEADTVRAIFAEYLRTRSIRKAIFSINAMKLTNRSGKLWSRTSLRRLLSNPTYIGTVAYAKREVRRNRIVRRDHGDWIVVEEACPPIVEKEQFDRVQEILRGNGGSHAWKEKSTYLLTGMVRCGICGARLSGMRSNKPNRKEHRYYRCTSRLQKGPKACSGLTCRADEIERAIVGRIVGFDADALRRELQRHREDLAREAIPSKRRREELQARFEEYRGRGRRLLELYEESYIDMETFRDRRRHLDEERLAIAKELAELDMRSPDDGLVDLDIDEVVTQFSRLRETFPHLAVVEQRQMLQSMIREITLRADGKVEVDFNLIPGLDMEGAALDGFQEFDLREKPEEPTCLGEQISAHRRHRALSQKALAGILGVNSYTLCQWERGATRPRDDMRHLIEEKTGLELLPPLSEIQKEAP